MIRTILAMLVLAGVADSEIRENLGTYTTYYHLGFDLHATNFKMRSSTGRTMLLSEGGMFEIYVDPKQFPVPAPNCHSELILRMPWTDANTHSASDAIEQKLDLYRRIKRLAATGDGVVRVSIELNPYVSRSTNAVGLELDFCNIYFRTAHGSYIGHQDALEAT